MKIRDIRAVEITLNPKPKTPPRTPSRAGTFQLNRPVSRYETLAGGRVTFLRLNGSGLLAL